ncbi:hypothetical protein [Clostridium psychrophilum]|uniref:hypothetical protein n=1 Tax=Clostridium psychrophilum TaxID=132926 RepID=UPI001C0CAFE9|nr:hypothetical protein [Clostridium psychrophilum]MBU3179794.1 hypothetical protein [Clostridium psychrophilum]
MKNKQKLINNLTQIIDKYSTNEKVKNCIQELYVQKKMPVRTVLLIFNKEKFFDSLLEIELGIWCMGLYKATKDALIDLEKYYTNDEILGLINYINKNDFAIETNEIILHNIEGKIIKGKTYYFCPFISFYDIYKFSTNSLITYNSEIQMNVNRTKFKNKNIKQENVNYESIDDISKLVEIDELPPSMITLNIRKSKFNSDNIIYNQITKNLEIKLSFIKDAYADNIDGYHRMLGIVNGVVTANAKNIKLEGGLMLLVTNYTEKETQNYINIQKKQKYINNHKTNGCIKDDTINILYDGF